MKTNTLYTVISLLSSSVIIYGQMFNISDSLNSFGINLLKETAAEAGDSINVALSPYTVWSILLLLSEGAQGNTLEQLRTALLLPQDGVNFRNSFQNLSKYLKVKTDATDLDYNMALFHGQNFPVKKTFEKLAKTVYDVAVKPVDFTNTQKAETVINKFVADATRQRIPKFVSEDDVRNAHIFLTSVLFFKGLWGSPFKPESTRNETFYDEKNNEIGRVEMMFQIGAFPYVRLEEIGAHVLELPYGTDRKMSMVMVLPFRGETISGVLNLLSQKSMSFVIDALAKSEEEFIGDDIYVYVPKFKISSDFNLNVVLLKMGIEDVFDHSKADLLGIFDHYLYLSRLIQRADIEVDEEGTIVTAAAGAGFIDKMSPLKIKFNRPFMYFVVNKPTKTVIFSGKFSKPKNSQHTKRDAVEPTLVHS